jgi:uncharacterized protein YbjQ (UPF0145 family)
MFRIVLGGIIIAIMFLGCSTVMSVKTDNSDKEYAPTEESSIKVYSTSDAGRSYVVLGEIVAMADVGENSASIVNKLKKSASRFGADAIVNLRLNFGMGFWATGLKGTATAVKFN